MRKLVMLSENVNNAVTASLDELRSESHPAQHVIPLQLLRIHSERSFLPEDFHEKSIQVPLPTD